MQVRRSCPGCSRGRPKDTSPLLSLMVLPRLQPGPTQGHVATSSWQRLLRCFVLDGLVGTREARTIFFVATLLIPMFGVLCCLYLLWRSPCPFTRHACLIFLTQCSIQRKYSSTGEVPKVPTASQKTVKQSLAFQSR